MPWKTLDKVDKSKYLQENKTIKKEGDWSSGFLNTIKTIIDENSLPEDVVETALDLSGRVMDNPDYFSSKSRLSIASAVVALSYKKEVGKFKKKEIYPKLPSTDATIRKSVSLLESQLEE